MTPSMPRYLGDYYEALRALEQQGARTEGALRVAFHNLLTEAGRTRGLTVLGEQTVQLANKKQIRFDERIFRSVFNNPDFVQRNEIVSVSLETVRPVRGLPPLRVG